MATVDIDVNPPGYPAQFENDVVLADGGTVHVRPIRPDDAPALSRFHSRLSDRSVYFRYFSAHPRLSERELEALTQVDYVTRMALVAMLGDEIIGVVRYEGEPGSDRAEVAFTVDDAHHGRGIATVLLEHLAAAARENGIREFTAVTLVENQAMLGVFREAGFDTRRIVTQGEVDVRFPVDATEDLACAVARREHQAEARSVGRLLAPRSIAVVGAGRERGGLGHEVFRNLLAGEFNGPIYPVHPKAPHVAGVRAYPTVLDVPDDVDLAVICIPAAGVAEVVRQCAEKHVHGLVMITAGFAETGVEGAAAERHLVHLARRNGMRLIGPNCMGIVNTDPDVSMNATFAPVAAVAGRAAFASQSGALGITALERSERMGLGISTFVSVGNKADVSSNDLLQYWEDDPGTDVVLLYLESFGNPGKFSRIARRISRKKPIVAVKGGRTSAGTRAASSHTAALATPDLAVDALFRQTGVIRVDTLEELFDVAQVLAHQPLPPGRRVAIVGNSGGPGILAADACEAAGLEVPELSEATQGALRALLPPAAAVRNPVDMMAAASADDYDRVLRLVLADDGIDSVIVVFTAPLVTRLDDIARAIAAIDAGDKPIVANFLGVEGICEALRRPPGNGAAPRRMIASFPFPESAARALARAAHYAAWRDRPPGTVPKPPGIDTQRARVVVDAALAAHPDGTWLDFVAAADLFASYGIPTAPAVRAASPEEAVAAAEGLGFPVALKVASGAIVHKTDVGGVRLGLTSPEDVRAAYEQMRARLGGAMGGVVVQRMADPGVETIVGVVRDPSFGPLVMFGIGGVATELVGDRMLGVSPLTDRDAADLVRSLRSTPLLTGFRGSPPVDLAALEDVVVRVSQLAEQVPEIAEMDLNPVIATPSGALAVDCKVRLTPAPPHRPGDLRRLR